MTRVTAIASPAAKAPLERTTIERRDLREHDVLIEIAYAGICHGVAPRGGRDLTRRPCGPERQPA